MKPSLPDALRLPELTLAAHAYDHKRSSGIISDLTAERWWRKLFDVYEDMLVPDAELTNGIIVRSLVIDYAVLDFVTRYQRVVIVDLGCGFSTRKYRLGMNVGQWVDVDLPEVLSARQALEPGSVLAIDWDLTDTSHCPLDSLLETTAVNYLFILEGVLNHLSKEDAKALVGLLHARYPGARVIGTVITENGLTGARSLAAELGLSQAMWAVLDMIDLEKLLAPAKVQKTWFLGKVASQLGLIRPMTGDEASGLVFLASL